MVGEQLAVTQGQVGIESCLAPVLYVVHLKAQDGGSEHLERSSEWKCRLRLVGGGRGWISFSIHTCHAPL